MECPDCRTIVRDGARFCSGCGSALPLFATAQSAAFVHHSASVQHAAFVPPAAPGVQVAQKANAVGKVAGGLVLLAGVLRLAGGIETWSSYMTELSMLKYLGPWCLGAVALICVGVIALARGSAVLTVITVAVFFSMATVAEVVTVPAPDPFDAFGGLRSFQRLSDLRPFDIVTVPMSFLALLASFILGIAGLTQERQ